MDCPQCEGEDALTTYTDGEREAFVCENCGYVGIPADHRGEGRESETWADAVSRFHEHHPFLRDGEPPGAETPVGAAVDRPDDRPSGPQTWDEALQAFTDDGDGDDEPESEAPDATTTASESAADGDGEPGGETTEDGTGGEAVDDREDGAATEREREEAATDGTGGPGAGTDAADGVGPNA